MMGNFFLIVFYLCTPALIIFLCQRYQWLDKIGPVLLSYIIGMAAGNMGLIKSVTGVKPIQENISAFAILVAIPLLFFSLNIRQWKHLAFKAGIALVTGILSALTSVTVGYYLTGGHLPDGWKIAGMLVGVYTGGTPNLAALQIALKVDANTYIALNTIDILVSAIYFMFLLSFGKTLLRRFLPKFKPIDEKGVEIHQSVQLNYKAVASIKYMVSLAKALILAIGVAAISLGFSFMFTGRISMLIIILSITSISIVLSLINQVNQLHNTFESGMYLILIFSLVVASQADFGQFRQIPFLLFQFMAIAVFGSLLLHVLMAKIFKVDADTLMAASTGLINSPPFVPVIAANLKNKDVIISGITIGIIGYAIGNYLGIGLAYFLK